MIIDLIHRFIYESGLLTYMAIPDDIVEEVGLKEPTSLKKSVKLIYDAKHTKQYTIRIPPGFIEKVDWEGGDMIQIELDDKGLKLTRDED